MKIPDEVEFARLRKKSLLDSKGWVTCLHCIYCRLTTQNQIYDDGQFYCASIHQWRDADDLIEYRCQGFRVKQCKLCSHYKDCENKDKATFCNRFTYRRVQTLVKGRRRPLPKYSSLVHATLEQEYIEVKQQQELEYLDGIKERSTDYPRDRVLQIGECEQIEEGDEAVEYLPTSDYH